ncbi:cytochrome P450 [Lentzea sp. NPDC059081]|uniref:cytochrome P450 n=1 Tax=Lentzea sp. NPDC059081 TaxID=3346719 RepID=UPI0036C26EBC
MTVTDETSPVRQVSLPDGRTIWQVRRYELVRELLTSGELSNDTSAMGDRAPLAGLPEFVRGLVERGMLNNDPPAHTRKRSAVAQHFTSRRAKAARSAVRRIAGELVDAFAGEPVVDLFTAYTTPLPTRVLGEIIGIPAADCRRVQQLSDVFVTDLLSSSERQELAGTELLTYYAELGRQRRKTPAADVITDLVGAGMGDDDDISSMVFVVMLAGQTAATQLLTKGLWSLLTHERQFAGLRADRSLLSSTVDECLRYQTPLALSAFRSPLHRPYVVAGVEIPAGDVVVCSLAEANRDPDRFADPDAFDVRREDNQHLAFGYGLHRCLGAHLAKVEAEVAFETLMDRFDDIRLTGATDVVWDQTALMRRIVALPVRLSTNDSE